MRWVESVFATGGLHTDASDTRFQGQPPWLMLPVCKCLNCLTMQSMGTAVTRHTTAMMIAKQ